MRTKDLTASVLRCYQDTGSIRACARELEISQSAARKVLLTAGAIQTDLQGQIESLREDGKSSEDICAALEISKSCLSANEPYSKGSYLGDNKSKNALRIKKFRAKKKQGSGD